MALSDVAAPEVEQTLDWTFAIRGAVTETQAIRAVIDAERCAAALGRSHEHVLLGGPDVSPLLQGRVAAPVRWLPEGAAIERESAGRLVHVAAPGRPPLAPLLADIDPDAHGAGDVPSSLLESAIAVPQLRLVVLPVPKAASSSVLRALARLLVAEGLADGTTVLADGLHGAGSFPGFRLAHWDRAAAVDALTGPDWLRVAMVREPTSRLWSAYVNKVVTPTPELQQRFGDQPWFRPPIAAGELLEGFSAWLDWLGDHTVWTPTGQVPIGPTADAHWTSCSRLLGGVVDAGTEVFTTDQADRFERRLVEHGIEWRWGPREKRSILGFDPSIVDVALLDRVDRVAGCDRTRFGLAPPIVRHGADRAEAMERLSTALAPIAELLVRHHDLCRRVNHAEQAIGNT